MCTSVVCECVCMGVAECVCMGVYARVCDDRHLIWKRLVFNVFGGSSIRCASLKELEKSVIVGLNLAAAAYKTRIESWLRVLRGF
jgi:hypothetical protein